MIKHTEISQVWATRILKGEKQTQQIPYLGPEVSSFMGNPVYF